MKKIILILLILSELLFSSKIDTERKIYKHILYALYPDKENIKIWSDDEKLQSLLMQIPRVKTVSKLSDANLLIITKRKDIKSDKLKFTTSYPLLLHYEKSAIGGFYWQKGRPNILFLKSNLQKHHISLPESMHEYIEDTL